MGAPRAPPAHRRGRARVDGAEGRAKAEVQQTDHQRSAVPRAKLRHHHPLQDPSLRTTLWDHQRPRQIRPTRTYAAVRICGPKIGYAKSFGSFSRARWIARRSRRRRSKRMPNKRSKRSWVAALAQKRLLHRRADPQEPHPVQEGRLCSSMVMRVCGPIAVPAPATALDARGGPAGKVRNREVASV